MLGDILGRGRVDDSLLGLDDDVGDGVAEIVVVGGLGRRAEERVERLYAFECGARPLMRGLEG